MQRADASFVGRPPSDMNADEVLQHLPDAVLLVEDGRVIRANRAAQALWGHSDLVGASLASLMAAGEAERLERLEERRRAGWDLPSSCRIQLERAGPQPVWADVRLVASGPTRVLCARDITEQKRAEAVMSELAKLSADSGLLVGPEAMLDATAPVFEALGWTVALTEVKRGHSVTHRVLSPPGDAVGDYGRTLLGRAIPFEATPVLREVVAAKHALFFDDVPALLSGPERDAAALSESMTRARVARSAWCPIFDRGRVSHVMAVTGRDLTEHDVVALELFAAQLGAAAQLEKLRTELVRSERLAAVGEMAAVLAHEVRNPLAIIFNALATLRRSTSDDERAQLMEILGDEAERLRRLASDLLDFSHPGTASPETVALGPVVQAALEEARHDPAYGVRNPLVEIAGLSTEIRAWLDPLLVRRALVNLLANAFQHVPPGGRVLVTLAREGDDAVVRVHNEGPAPSGEVERRMFEPFFTTKPTGTGLGLAIVRRIAGDLGGSISYEASPDGVSFVLRVPAQQGPGSAPPAV